MRKNVFFIISLLFTFVIANMICLAQEEKSDTEKKSGKDVKIAVLNFKSLKGVDKDEAELLTTKFISELHGLKIFQIMDRQQMESIMKEKNIQISEDFNADTAAQMGASLGVKNVIIGEIGKLGSTYLANIRLVSVESREILETASVDNISSLGTMASMMRDLAYQIAGLKSPGTRPANPPVEDKSSQTAQTQPTTPRTSTAEPGALYLSHNLWYTDFNQINSLLLKTGTMITAGTKVYNVRVDKVSRREYIIFKTDPNAAQEYKILFDPGYHKPMTAMQFKDRMFKNMTFDDITASFTTQEVEAVKQGKVEVGMRRDAVIAAYGYPPEHKTLSLTNNKWTYWIRSTRDSIVLTFDAEGKVISVNQ